MKKKIFLVTFFLIITAQTTPINLPEFIKEEIPSKILCRREIKERTGDLITIGDYSCLNPDFFKFTDRKLDEAGIYINDLLTQKTKSIENMMLLLDTIVYIEKIISKCDYPFDVLHKLTILEKGNGDLINEYDRILVQVQRKLTYEPYGRLSINDECNNESTELIIADPINEYSQLIGLKIGSKGLFFHYHDNKYVITQIEILSSYREKIS